MRWSRYLPWFCGLVLACGSTSSADPNNYGGPQSRGEHDAAPSPPDIGDAATVSPPHGGETILPVELTGYRFLAANSRYLFVSAKQGLLRLAFDKLPEYEVIIDDSAYPGPFAVSEEHLVFMQAGVLWRFSIDGDAGEQMYTHHQVLPGRIYLDRGLVYFSRGSSVARLALDAPPEAEPEIVADFVTDFFVKDGRLLAIARDDELLLVDLDSQERQTAPLPGNPAVGYPYYPAVDTGGAYVLMAEQTTAELFRFQPADGTFASLARHDSQFGNHNHLAIHKGQPVYLLSSEARRNYSSLYLGGDDVVRRYGNDAIPQPAGVVIVDNYAYVSAVGTSGLVDDEHRFGTVMRFRLSD